MTLPGGGRIKVPAGGFRHIAVLRLSSLGDVVLTLPVVHALAAAHPEARISYWVKEEFRDAVRFDPAIAHVRELDRDALRIEDLVSMSAEFEDCDLIVDLHRSLRTRILTARQKAPLVFAPAARVVRERWVHARWTRPAPAPHVTARYAAAVAPLGVVVTGSPRMTAGTEAEAWAREWIAAWRPATATLSPDDDPMWCERRAPIAMCPAAHHATKRWIEAHWLVLHERLTAAGHPLLYFSLDRERRSFPALSAFVEQDARARWCTEPLPRMAALMSHCATAVTCDTGLMHVAAARGLRVVAMFGSTVPELGFAPAGEGHAVLCRHEPCQPCTLHGRAECPKGHFRCMNELAPTIVQAAVEQMLAPRDPVGIAEQP